VGGPHVCRDRVGTLTWAVLARLQSYLSPTRDDDNDDDIIGDSDTPLGAFEQDPLLPQRSSDAAIEEPVRVGDAAV
jgi:hypothetical protein